jgi:hypothetical protein
MYNLNHAPTTLGGTKLKRKYIWVTQKKKKKGLKSLKYDINYRTGLTSMESNFDSVNIVYNHSVEQI